MLELRTPKGSFDLAPDFSIVLVDNNNVLDWESTFNLTRTYPATLPWTRKNAQIWMHADKPDSSLLYDSIECDIIANGNLELKGRAYLLRTQENRSFDITVTYDKSLFNQNEKLRNINYPEQLSDPDTGEFNNLWNISNQDMLNAKFGDTPCVLPTIYQLNGVYEYVNQYDLAGDEYMPGRNIIPMFFAGYVIEQLCKYYGIQHTGVFYSDEDLQKLIIFNTYVQYGALMTVGAGGLDYWDTDQPLELKNHLPDITVSELLNAIRKRFAAGIDIDTRNNTMNIYTMKDMLSNKKVVDITDIVKGWGAQQINNEEVKNFVQVYDDQDTNEQYIKEAVPTFKGTKADLAALTATTPKYANDVYFVTRDGYYWKWNGTSWNRLQWDYYTKYNLDGNDDIVDNSSSLITNYEYDALNSRSYKCPHTAYDKTEFEKNNITAKLRWLLYHGMQEVQPSSPGYLYPYASIDNTATDGTVLGNIDLRDNGTYGLYAVYKKYRAQLRQNNRKVPVYIKNDIATTEKLTPETILRIKSQEYVWLEKRRVYDNKGLRETELMLIKI